jgi:hypothetical protein
LATPQEEFDSRYVTSTEVCVDLGVTRASVLNRRRTGNLPDAIEVRTRDGSIHLLLWERDRIGPHLEAWRRQLRRRAA